MSKDDHQETAWAGGGSWNPDPPAEPTPAPVPASPPPRSSPATSLPTKTQHGHGLVCGRFLPPHRGHRMLIEYARDSVEKLTVLVFAQPTDPIPADVRVAWIRALFTNIEVAAVLADRPAPDEPDFAARFVACCGIWRPPATAKRTFFTSDETGRAAAAALGAALVLVDPARVIEPISGTRLREDLLGNFEFLATPTRAAFVRRVAVLGAESTGKTTLCEALADRYQTTFVPEAARDIASVTSELVVEDLERAARQQLASEDAAAVLAKRVMFCDTNVRTVALWIERLFHQAPSAWLTDHAAHDAYDLYLVCASDVPFVGTKARDQPAARAAFCRRVLASTAERGAVVVELTGAWAERTARAVAAVDALIARGGFLAARAPALFQVLASGKL